MVKCSQQWISKHIINIVINDFRSVFELDFLESAAIKIDWIEICFDRYRCITKPFVWTTLRSIYEYIRNRRFVTNLFNIYFCTIRKRCLISFSQNRIQWFFECMTWINIWNWSNNHMLHSLQWIFTVSGCI